MQVLGATPLPRTTEPEPLPRTTKPAPLLGTTDPGGVIENRVEPIDLNHVPRRTTKDHYVESSIS
uniref:Uncharacterized protein n=1 Tax=Cannabis sativa TaxID=3483 RepID=A0A803RAD5_CANSA